MHAKRCIGFFVPMVVLAICPLTPAQTPEELIAVHTAFGEALNAHDFDLMMSYFAEEAVFNFVPSPVPMKGKQEIRTFFEDLLVSFPDFHTTDGRVLVAGNTVVVEHSLEGTHGGVWEGIPATGAPVSFPHLDIYDFEGDKIGRLTSYLDMLGPLVQVGAMPVPEMPLLVPTYALPEPEPTGQSPWDADVQVNLRWNTHDLPQYAKLHRSDALIFAGPLGTTVGRNEWIALTEMIFQGFSGQSHIVRRVDMGDGLILTEFVNRATHDGPYAGVPASGNPVNMRSASLSQYDADGLVAAASYYYDELTLMTQIMPPPAPESEEAAAPPE